MKKSLIIVFIAIILVVIVIASLYIKQQKEAKAEQARIAEQKRIEEERIAEQKRLHDEYATTFRITAAAVYLQASTSALYCTLISEMWGDAIKKDLDFNLIINKTKEIIEKGGSYKKMEDAKSNIDISMRKLINPPEDYKTGYNLLLEMYGYYVQLYNQACSPMGSLLMYNKDLNDRVSELKKSFDKISVVIPQIKDEVELQKKKIDLTNKL